MKKDQGKKRIELVCSVAELATLFERTTSITGILDQTVKLIAQHMGTDVCSIYLLETGTRRLFLRATVGLDSGSIGTVQLRLGEGVTGTALKEMRPIIVPSLSDSLYNKPFPGIGEENYEAFLAVPLIYQMKRIGVITLQHSKPNFFDNRDARAMTAIASQLATLIENAKLLMELHSGEVPHSGEDQAHVLPEFIKGNARSEGIAIGSAYRFADRGGDSFFFDPSRHYGQGFDAFTSSIEKTKNQIEQLQQSVEENLSDAGGLIFSSHLLMLTDEAFSGEMAKRIRHGTQTHSAVAEVVNMYIDLFKGSENEIVAEKVQDLKDLGHRILENLLPKEEAEYDYSGHIIIAQEVFPSELIRLTAQNAEGLILQSRGVTSHILILAKSLDMPIITLDSDTLLSVPDRTPLVLDAFQGTVFINPRREVLNHYRHYLITKQQAVKEGEAVKESTYLKSGEEVHIYANVSLLSDVRLAKEYKAKGIGLYRSEFPFLIRNSFPSEEEQCRIYSKLLSSSAPLPVVMRVLDLGGDKKLTYEEVIDEPNPFLGLRGIRFALKNVEILRTQIRAMLAAGVQNGVSYPVHILVPFVSSLDEVLEVKSIISQCITSLRKEGIQCAQEPKVGIMVELPSAVFIIDELVQVVDFISIGTNDLVQYIIGVDRTNAQVADYYMPMHPSVLRSIQLVASAARRHGLPVSVCGESAADPILAQLFIGMGIEQLSVAPKSIPRLKRCIERFSMKEAQDFAQKALKAGTIRELKEILN
ncbi:MAG: phosphoenolpyruvate--protein phosphotransferase [Spirochaetales bacterium]|nr:phosphoenolpyruvate--protein phosphotransferase [Spirochaetales bacterium]